MAKLLLDKTKYGWWKSAVFYQIYPKSFLDTTGTGVGDLQGIISKLDYLEKLGVDGIGLSSVFSSPQSDNGYDVADYYDIDPMIGSMQDMEELIARAREREISVILDLVLSCGSDRHSWFMEAMKGEENPYHNYYIWRSGTPDRVPNDVRAACGGPAWTWVPEVGKWYFHRVSSSQPDLNWENPSLRQEFYKVIRFWVDKGIGGFRLDGINRIAKDPDRMTAIDGPKLHTYLQELSREAFSEAGLISAGKVWRADTEQAGQSGEADDGGLSMVFRCDHMELDRGPGSEKWDMIPLQLTKLKECFRRRQQEPQGMSWDSLFMNDHDLPRIVSRWGNDREYRVESAQMLATMLYGMRGTPWIYQGEELGMTNAALPIEAYVDPETLNVYKERIDQGYEAEDVLRSIHGCSCDNARTPMQWTAGENAGFTTGNPWIAVNPNYTAVNADTAMADRHSMYNFYRHLLRLRKEYNVFRDGSFELWDADNEKVFSYTRDSADEHLLVVCNFSADTMMYEIPARFWDSDMLINNYSWDSFDLRPYEAAIFYYNDHKLI